MPIDWDTVPAPEAVGEELVALMRDLFPIPRSLTGRGSGTHSPFSPGIFRSRSSKPIRNGSLRLGRPSRVEPPCRVDRRPGWRSHC